MRKTRPLTVGEYLALSDTDMGEHAGERADELQQVQKVLRDAVAEAALLWDGQKLVGEPKTLQKFLGWKPKPAPKKKVRAESVESHYTPEDLAQEWKLSVDTIRRIFVDEPDVLKYSQPNPKNKRPYVTMRIPVKVAQRVHKRLTT